MYISQSESEKYNADRPYYAYSERMREIGLMFCTACQEYKEDVTWDGVNELCERCRRMPVVQSVMPCSDMLAGEIVDVIERDMIHDDIRTLHGKQLRKMVHRAYQFYCENVRK